MDPAEKRAAYAADITYSVHSELGFDYLRDNMAESVGEKVQRGLNFCLIDEADSILIDEAKTPLIISGGEGEDTSEYFMADRFVRTLVEDDYEIDEESKAISLTYSGIKKQMHFLVLIICIILKIQKWFIEFKIHFALTKLCAKMLNI